MTIKVRNAMKNISIFSLLLLFFISCSDDELNSIDAGFINNLNFITDTIVSDITFSSDDVPSVLTTPAGQYLLGVYHDPDFGTLSASFVSQLVLPTEVTYYSEVIEPDSIVKRSIDDVVLYIPYQATARSIDANNIYTYQLDSIFGVKDYKSDPTVYGNFDVEVYELETFLNPLSPTDPSKQSTYYTNKGYKVVRKGSEANGSLAAVNYTPSSLDTVTAISRKIGGLEYKLETVSMNNNAPRMEIRLDKDFFETNFLNKLVAGGDDNSDDFASQDSFNRYFKGLYVLTDTLTTSPGSMPSLLLSNAYVEMYYTNVISLKSTGLNIDTIPEVMRFSFGGVKASKYVPNRLPKATDKMYVQGAVGSIANIKLLGYDDLDPTKISDELAGLRKDSNDEKGNPLWLINEASLKLYVDDAKLETALDTVYKLFLYKKVQGPSPELESLYNSQLLDYISAANISAIEGNLQLDNDGKDENDGYYYKFRITDYVTELLKFPDFITKPDGTKEYINNKNIDNLGLKLYNNGDYPSSTADTIVGSESWNPRGVVLFGGVNDPKKPVLEINYSYQKTSE
jgi:hypothetical protein